MKKDIVEVAREAIDKIEAGPEIKRWKQKVEVWISNVKRIYNWTEEEARKSCSKIRPYEQELDEILNKYL